MEKIYKYGREWTKMSHTLQEDENAEYMWKVICLGTEELWEENYAGRLFLVCDNGDIYETYF